MQMKLLVAPFASMISKETGINDARIEKPNTHNSECNCLFYHPLPNTQDWDHVVANLRYARVVGDVSMIPLLIEQLSGCKKSSTEV